MAEMVTLLGKHLFDMSFVFNSECPLLDLEGPREGDEEERGRDSTETEFPFTLLDM